MYLFILKDNIELKSRFRSLTKSNSKDISLNTGNLYIEMVKNNSFNFCNYPEEIFIPLNIIPENRLAGIVKLKANKDECQCCSLPFCPNCCSCNCCRCCDPNCNCCSNSSCCGPNCCDKCCDHNCFDRCCDPNRCCCGLCEKPPCCRSDR